ncbi:MAG: prepilin-type N-terminal cleavage/methylation domain-containing protein [Candidatus Aceula meridiana]|nr:prepilin-type N-terminal cleavage/methylation domain-containing protein [Candidatus Aceula meridiana]
MNEIINKNTKRSFGFTLTEVIIAISVVSALAAIGISKFPILVEKERVKAVERVLADMQASQRRYFQDTKTYANTKEKLDTEWKNVTGFAISVLNNASRVAMADRRPIKDYVLSVDAGGGITCSGEYCGLLAYSNDTLGGGEPDPPGCELECPPSLGVNEEKCICEEPAGCELECKEPLVLNKEKCICEEVAGCELTCKEPLVLNKEKCICEEVAGCELECKEPLVLNKEKCICEEPAGCELTCKEHLVLNKEKCICEEISASNCAKVETCKEEGFVWSNTECECVKDPDATVDADTAVDADTGWSSWIERIKKLFPNWSLR